LNINWENNKEYPFNLFTIPPKNILKCDQKTLKALNLVPDARLHFEWKNICIFTTRAKIDEKIKPVPLLNPANFGNYTF